MGAGEGEEQNDGGDVLALHRAFDREDNARKRERFTILYERHGRSVLAWALRRVDPPADAEDILAETFSTCWRRLDDVPEGDDAASWLYSVATRVLANHRRSQQRRVNLRVRLAGQPGGVGHELDDRQLDLLQEAMTQLRPADAEILRLVAWEDLKPAELAPILGCTSNAASIRLHRARRALADAYGQSTPAPGGPQDDAGPESRKP